MPTTRPRVPGWHPDPDDPASLRHWNGRRWGNERRPRPSWAPQPRSAGLVSTGGSGSGTGGPDGEPQRPSRRRWYLLAAGALVIGLLVVSVPAFLGTGITIPPRTVSDASYTTRAEKVCAGTLPKLREDRPESREDNGTPAAFAARIERAAKGLEAVTTDLRGIPTTTAEDGATIDRWLDDWEAYTALGHQYSAAIAAGELERTQELSAQSQVLAKRVYAFSNGNDMPSCIF